MDYSKDYNSLPDEDLEERDAIGLLAEENVLENQRELEDEAEEAREIYELKKLTRKYSDKVIGILKELNEEHIANAKLMAELQPRVLDEGFSRTEIKDN